MTVDLGHATRVRGSPIQTVESRFLARSMRTVGEFAYSDGASPASAVVCKTSWRHADDGRCHINGHLHFCGRADVEKRVNAAQAAATWLILCFDRLSLSVFVSGRRATHLVAVKTCSPQGPDAVQQRQTQK